MPATPVFRFKAMAEGEFVVEGQVEAADLASARRAVRDRYGRLLLLEPVVGQVQFRVLPWQHPGPTRLGASFRQLAMLIGAGVPLFRSIEAVSTTDHPLLARGLQGLGEDLVRGLSLSQALSRSPALFGPDVVASVRAGEESGRLVDCLHRLASTFERRGDLQRRVASAMAYPACVLLLAAAVILLFLFFVLPTMEPVFQGFGAELPMFVKALGLLRNPWVMAGLVLGLAGLAALAWRLPLRDVIHRVPVVRRLSLSRTLQSMSSLLASGVRLDRALDHLREDPSDPALAAGFAAVRKNIVEGDTLAEAFAKEPVFPRLVPQMVLVGETSGSLPEMLERCAGTFELEVEQSIERMLALIEPAVMVFLGGVAAALVLAAFVPLLQLMAVL